MKTTDLIFQNQKVLNALQEMLLQTKKHVDFLAANAPEIRASLESIAESLQTGVGILENQIVFNRDNAAIVEKLNGKFELEKACKNQAYDFILTERLLNRFKTFCSCYPVSTYNEKTGADILAKRVK